MSIQRSKVGIQDWSLSDLTVGLYLIYLSQASSKKIEEFKGVQIFSDAIVISCLFSHQKMSLTIDTIYFFFLMKALKSELLKQMAAFL